ncbi:tyrosine-type recombinase/integrase [Aestuariicoccus sp. MJ-SS9]|uniref:tyrosine-type recombinase/integrase n=1 Tax=Aestuariicoccus sp. MJ-SS9 TaxID=3079855 RepID=UPI002906160B|nr:integrase arm-type DNA-binding domain-containing protein [Aestuariicoccus sp. MJ-SS9]MDU8911681.1 integrase arm-type DNA-binding domain-containing protein [Aestuariicoccus sp. MJ-SS9]
MSAVEVKRLKHHGGKNTRFVAVGGVTGLILQITPTEAKSWLFRYTMNGKRHAMGLGSYPTVSLSLARERARDAADAVWRGENPLRAKQSKRAVPSFSEAMGRFIEKKEPEFSSEKYAKLYRSELERYAVPEIGDTPVDEIDRRDVLRVLGPIWQEKTATAKKLRGKIEGVLDWAKVNGFREGLNPAAWKGNLEHDLASASKLIRAKQEHRPALSLSDAPQWFADLKKRGGVATRALEFLALSAVRSGEVRGATWDEIDQVAKLWIIPAERMKPGERGLRHEHRVPLTDDMLVLLDAQPRYEGSPYIFPAARGGMLTDAAMSDAMRRINAAKERGYLDARTGRPAVPHGLRSTFRDWAAEQGVDRDLAELTLAHVVGSDVERAYRRTDMIERRRIVLASWGRFLKGEGRGKVISLEVVK